MTRAIRLDELVSILRGNTPALPSGDPSGPRVIGQSEIVSGGSAPVRHVDYSRVQPGLAPVLLAADDVVLAAMDRSHRSLLIDDELAGAVLGRECLALRIATPNSPIRPAYLAAWTRSPEFQTLASAGMVGTTMPRLSPKTLGSFLIPILSQERQMRIERLVREFASAQAALARTENLLQRLEVAELSGAFKEEL